MMIDRGRSDIAPGVEQVEETEKEGVQEMVQPVVTENEQEVAQPVVTEELGRGHRKTIPSVRLRDYVTYNAQAGPDKQNTISSLQSELPSTVPGKTKCLYPITDYITDENFSEHHKAFLAAVSARVIPKNYKEEFADERWKKAVRGEADALEINRTWDVLDLPPGKKAIGCKWVFTIKYNADGTIERYKARLVCFGNHQIKGEDYEETFAPVAKMDTVRILLEVALARNWEVHQMDVSNAFLHGDLEEEVYMRLPPGFQSKHQNKVCRLRKSLYGLKQAPRCWFEKLTKALTSFGFVESYEDASLFIFVKDGRSIRVLIYVDDLIVAGNDLEMIKRFKAYMSKCFLMKDLGRAKYFLGIKIARGPLGIFLSQRKYALDIVNENGMLGCKPVSTPMEINNKLLAAKRPLF